MAVHFDRVGEEGHVGSVSTQEKGPNDIYIYIEVPKPRSFHLGVPW